MPRTWRSTCCPLQNMCATSVSTAADVPDKWAPMAACKPGAWVAFLKGLLPRVQPRRAPLPPLEALGSGKR
jgi:hypothetical protein